MGVINDLLRLMGAGARARTNTAENLHESAKLAEQFADWQPGQPVGSHGMATGNPFADMDAYSRGLSASGTVVALAPTGADIGGTPVYLVHLDVLMDGRQPYRTTYQTVIAAGALPNWQPGKVMPFRVSPTDPNALILG